MSPLPFADEDMHVHSTFSDGTGTLEQNLAAATRRGLRRLTFVEHVRAGTDWAAAFVGAVRSVAESTSIELRCGLEAKLLDLAGALDLPADTGGADCVYIADHRVPTADGPADPATVRELIVSGELDPDAVIADIIEATSNSLGLEQPAVIAHLFSVLPKLGLDESQVPLGAIERLAAVTATAGARIEISERWRCPSARTLSAFDRRGVPILLSTDSHTPAAVGRYEYCTSILEQL
ncbi:MAG: PHP domain-containing protein [Solirubrobacteraceae bacterium]